MQVLGIQGTWVPLPGLLVLPILHSVPQYGGCIPSAPEPLTLLLVRVVRVDGSMDRLPSTDLRSGSTKRGHR